jgi:hypothetical protein
MRASHGPDSSLLQMVFDASSQTFRCSMAMGWRGVSDPTFLPSTKIMFLINYLHDRF